MTRNLRILKLFKNILSFLNILYKILNWRCISSQFFHSYNIKLEMRDMTFSIRMYIGLFSHHNFIDKSRSISVFYRCPYLLYTCELPLKLFKENHKIPYSENMTLHKYLHIVLSFDSLINFMIEKGLPVFL